MRAARAILFIVLGLLAFVLAALVPAHLRALDEAVVRAKGADGPTLINEGAQLAKEEKPGPAELVMIAARAAGVPQHEDLARYLDQFNAAKPEIARYGAAASYLDPLFSQGAQSGADPHPTVLDLMLPEAARAMTLRTLQQSTRGGVQELLENRELKRTTLLPPVASASGQALDTAILLTALLVQTDLMPDAVAGEVVAVASAANRGKSTGPVEAVYLDILTLARTLNWAQFTSLIGLMDSVETLRALTHFGSQDRDRLALVFTAAYLAGSGGPVARYLRHYPEEAPGWLKLAMASGSDGVRLVLREQEPVQGSSWRSWLAEKPGLRTVSRWLTRLALSLPLLALVFKYVQWFNAAFCIVRGIGLILPHERTVEGPTVAAYQQQTLALLLVVFAVLLWEPHLARGSEEARPPVGWNLPVLNAAVGDKVNEALKPIMTDINWIALVVFAVVQAALYALNLIKLREIRRQSAASELKLRLLDNEEHMFDAGLYVGLGGTVLGLILPTFNVVQPSLMVAYASTLFGIIFVSLLKICHVRPYRRGLILDSTLGSL